jgi:hypothetical protein
MALAYGKEMQQEPTNWNVGDLKQALRQLQNTVASVGAETNLRDMVGQLVSLFRQTNGETELDSSAIAKSEARSLWVEMDKQIRLLELDVLFWQAASGSNAVRRQQQMNDRIDLLLRYCDAWLEKWG